MKNILILISTILTFTSCSYNVGADKKQTKSAFEIYNEAYEKATKSKIDIDTIFLGLRFGMTKDEVYAHLKKMVRKGKIKINALDQYEYMFNTSTEEISATIGAKFFKGKLYELSLNLDTYYLNGVPLPSMDMEVMLDRIRTQFLVKYVINKKGVDRYNYNIGIGNTFCYINKNLVVEFSPIGQMTYTNAPIAAKKDGQEKTEKVKKVKSSISDL